MGYMGCGKVFWMQLLIGSWLPIMIGGFLALVLSRWPRLSTMVGSCSAIAGSAIGLGAAVPGFRIAKPLILSLPWALPGASFSLLIDGLAAFFLVPLFLISLPRAIYGHEYMAGSRHRLPGLHGLFYSLLILPIFLTRPGLSGAGSRPASVWPFIHQSPPFNYRVWK